MTIQSLVTVHCADLHCTRKLNLGLDRHSTLASVLSRNVLGWTLGPSGAVCPDHAHDEVEQAVRDAIHAETGGNITFHPGGQDLARLIVVAVQAALKAQKDEDR